MAFRSSQQEKFKNIVLKVEPMRSHSPDIQTSNLIKPTSSPTNNSTVPRTPANAYKYFAKQAYNQQAETSQIQAGVTNEFNSHSQGSIKPENTSSNILTENSRHPSTHLITSQIQETEQALITRLQRQIHEKTEIIAQLKNIIRISNENNAKGKYKAIFLQDKSTQRRSDDQERELKQLRHSVKILTIQNNSLSDYIDRLKATLGLNQVEYIDIDSKKQERDHLSLHQAKQINRLNQIIREQELQYEQKIDQFVNSHKSLSHEYKILESAKDNLQRENQNLGERLREAQQNYQRLFQGNDERYKNPSTQKFTIQKIKEQYSESLRQFKQTVAYETDHLFDQFSSHLEKIAKKVSFFEGKIANLQENLIKLGQKGLRQSVARKKSDIYIEEGGESSASSNSRRKLKNMGEVEVRTVFTSRVYEQSRQSEVQATVPLRTEIIRLKQIVNELQSQISQRSDYYTFRQRQYQNSSAELSSYRMKYALKDEELLKMRREIETNKKELLDEIEKHKDEIDKLQRAYKIERANLHETYVADVQLKDNIIEALKTEVSSLRQVYQQCTFDLKKYASSTRLQNQLQTENQRLRHQLQECVDKLEQYKKICLLMKEQSIQDDDYQQVLKDMRSQICLIRQKYHNDLSELSHLQQEKTQLIVVNQEINLQLQQSLNSLHKYQQEEAKLRETIKLLETQKSGLAQRLTYLQNNRVVLQREIRAKDQAERGLIQQKIQLQKQVVGYLNLMRKKSLEETKDLAKQRCIHQEFGLEQLLTKVQKLETTLNQQRFFKHQKQQQIAKVLSETIVDP